MTDDPRVARRHARSSKSGDTRTPGQKDRDRILYSAPFRRLAEVTQVVSPIEGYVFHNRLTHTLKVGQLARRTAQQLIRAGLPDLEGVDGLDPEVVEAAALAHDLGHPPFGHIAEKELDRLVRGAGSADGFEGNAQSFRIITRLAAHSQDYSGLNLTRGALDAVLKYPWLRGDGHRQDKFGAYRSESRDFRFAREGKPEHVPALSAQIMDFADSVTYSVHDFFDFYQAGFIPTWEVNDDLPEHLERFKRSGKVDATVLASHEGTIEELVTLLPGSAYHGTSDERVEVGVASSWLINDFVSQIRLEEQDGYARLAYPHDVEVRMRFLQNLVWHYVIVSEPLASQQVGQVRIVRDLFRTYLASAAGRLPHDLGVIPAGYGRIFEEVGSQPKDERRARFARLAADIVAGLTEDQARRLHRRFRGMAMGSVTDLITA